MIQIDYQDKRPIYEQVIEKIQNLIIIGVLTENDKMPSVRSLAIDLSINPNTIQKAYQELERLGFIYTVKGRGGFVASQSSWKKDISDENLNNLKDVLIELDKLGVSKSKVHDMVDKYMKGNVEND
ncbi:MAG: GntR family transcriptional regulator [Lachnospiraceae bacterium]|nr:GntR family transcriptional regulator [Candidatus Colinaster equi]